MLSLSNSFVSTIIKYLVIARVSQTNEKTKTLHDLSTKIRIAVAMALTDSFIVFGVSFFSSLTMLGYDDLMLNIKLSMFSAFLIAGLAFFNELKSKMKLGGGSM